MFRSNSLGLEEAADSVGGGRVNRDVVLKRVHSDAVEVEGFTAISTSSVLASLNNFKNGVGGYDANNGGSVIGNSSFFAPSGGGGTSDHKQFWPEPKK